MDYKKAWEKLLNFVNEQIEEVGQEKDEYEEGAPDWLIRDGHQFGFELTLKAMQNIENE